MIGAFWFLLSNNEGTVCWQHVFGMLSPLSCWKVVALVHRWYPCVTVSQTRCIFFLGLQDGKSVGSLILGPDGEIIQLSLFVNSQDRSNSDPHEQGVQLSFDMKSKDNSDLFYNVFQLCRFCLQKVKSYPGWLSCSLNAQKQVYKHFHERFYCLRCTFSTQFRASM